MRNRYRDASAAGPNIDDGLAAVSPGKCQRTLDDEPGLGTGDQNGSGDIEVEAPELAPTQDLRDSLTCGTAGDQSLETIGKVGRLEVASADDEVGAVPTEDMTRQYFRVD